MRRIFALILLLALLIPSCALATPNYRYYKPPIAVYVKADRAAVYKQPSAASTLLGRPKRGERFVCFAQGDGWAMLVNASGKIGYCQKSLLSKKPVGERVWVDYDMACAVELDGGGTKTISLGQEYELIGTKGKRSHIRNAKGETGWCDSDMLSKKNPNGLHETLYVQCPGAKLFSQTVTTASARTLKQGQAVTAVAQRGSWYRVKVNGRYGYMHALTLDSERAPADGRTLYWKYDGEPLYMNGKIVCRPMKGEALKLKGVTRDGKSLTVKTLDGISGHRGYGFFEY